MSATATVTGKVGAGATMTAQVFSNVTFFSFDTVNFVLNLTYVDGNGVTKIACVDILAATTITVTLSAAAGNWTITVS